MMPEPNRIKAMWLCSWFPDPIQPQNGDFIERHAIATALYTSIDLFHVASAPLALLGNSQLKKIVSDENPHLRCHCILYAKKNNHLASKIRSVVHYFYQYRKMIRRHIAQKGVPQIVHVHIAMKDGIIALWLKKVYKVPYVLSEHWSIYHKEQGKIYQKKSFVFRFFVKKILKESSMVMPVSAHLGQILSKIEPSINYKVIPNVVNTQFFHRTYRKKYDAFTFIHVSILDSNKNPEGIIAAFEKVQAIYPLTQLMLIGDLDRLKTKFANHNCIQLIPNVSNEKVASYLERAHVFVLFSYVESQPCVILESLCCGIPVIATKVGGIPEILTPENGALILPGDSDALAEKMCNLIRHYGQYNKEKISERARSIYSFETVGAEINTIYQSVISGAKTQA